MSVTKRLLIVVGGTIAGGLCYAAAAWACTPPSYIAVAGTEADANVGVAGTEVRITGGVSASDANPAPIELHWRASNGQEIQLLKTLPAQTSYGAFSTTVQVPTNSSPGIYHIVAFAQNREDLGTATAAYKVVAPSAGTGSPTNGSPPAASQTDASAIGGTATSSEPAVAPPSPSPAAAVPSSSATARPAPVGQAPAQAPANASTVAAADPVADTRPVATPAVVASSPAAADAARPPDGIAAATPAGQTAGGPSGRSTYDDLWSATSKSTGLGLEPSTIGQPSGATASLTLAIAATSAGFVLLAFGFALGEVRRRRVPVRI